MVKKPTLILLGILIILGAVAWWTQKAQPDFLKADMTATPTTVPSPFTAWKFENTRLIKYQNPDGSPLDLRMGKDFNSWSIDQDSAIPVNSGKVMQLISELQYMKPIAKLESATADDAMGLDAGAKIITLVDDKGATIEMKLGQPTATTSGTYVKVADSYYIVNTPVVEEITKILTVEGLAKPTETPTLVSGTPTP
ncbi:DUF4340 domain-containing protein [Leptolinea tardivitalis]|uniref:Uncharacterized protein n=1 Tax=Leptolinea tardivitalis TaxID=229920 RepID=A0A0P6X4F4_9CHLR|nr:DUF4340 domain-containing protein [Leptolinea tardivitalis]KPL74302.1 hypothetical protein ADM99_01670 [Leptolinea tardivitalis]GAP20510.1 hypothetical protein LTAR_00702 [Leptolinea tardivitalis]